MPRIKKDLTIAKTPAQEVNESTRALQRKQDRPKKSTNKARLMELVQQDGKLYNKKGVKSLDELFGMRDSKYSTESLAEYKEQLENMNISDLQRHAASVQILPKDDRKLLTKILIREFEISNSRKLNTAEHVAFAKPITKEVEALLAD